MSIFDIFGDIATDISLVKDDIASFVDIIDSGIVITKNDDKVLERHYRSIPKRAEKREVSLKNLINNGYGSKYNENQVFKFEVEFENMVAHILAAENLIEKDTQVIFNDAFTKVITEWLNKYYDQQDIDLLAEYIHTLVFNTDFTERIKSKEFHDFFSASNEKCVELMDGILEHLENLKKEKSSEEKQEETKEEPEQEETQESEKTTDAADEINAKMAELRKLEETLTERAKELDAREEALNKADAEEKIVVQDKEVKDSIKKRTARKTKSSVKKDETSEPTKRAGRKKADKK